jgi:hypothetical protein
VVVQVNQIDILELQLKIDFGGNSVLTEKEYELFLVLQIPPHDTGALRTLRFYALTADPDTEHFRLLLLTFQYASTNYFIKNKKVSRL